MAAVRVLQQRHWQQRRRGRRWRSSVVSHCAILHRAERQPGVWRRPTHGARDGRPAGRPSWRQNTAATTTSMTVMRLGLSRRGQLDARRRGRLVTTTTICRRR